MKAGLGREDWREGAEIYIFSATIFHDNRLDEGAHS
jgi:hypothetical protein